MTKRVAFSRGNQLAWSEDFQYKVCLYGQKGASLHGFFFHTFVAGGAVEEGIKESMLLETLAMRNMSNSRRSSSYGLISVRILCYEQD